ncbi:hypothetical protein [Clostridium novyi]|uniref:hypothetical protein n=1 Tax=Clostridium novyi TaxID=1542 RepID=UPI000AB1C55F|nr:hypothetical protein [Clostridium novyi]
MLYKYIQEIIGDILKNSNVFKILKSCVTVVLGLITASIDPVSSCENTLDLCKKIQDNE